MNRYKFRNFVKSIHEDSVSTFLNNAGANYLFVGKYYTEEWNIDMCLLMDTKSNGLKLLIETDRYFLLEVL